MKTCFVGRCCRGLLFRAYESSKTWKLLENVDMETEMGELLLPKSCICARSYKTLAKVVKNIFLYLKV